METVAAAAAAADYWLFYPQTAGSKGATWLHAGGDRGMGGCPTPYKEKVRSTVPSLLLGRVEIERVSVF